MERVISPEERMKRAEEIYYRRKTQGVRVSTASVNIGATNKISLGKKMAVQIVVCMLIYGSFWALQNYKSVFSDNVINQTKAVLSYDINFQNWYNQSREYFESHFNNIIKTDSSENIENNENADKEENSENDGQSADSSDNDNSEETSQNGESLEESNQDESYDTNEVSGDENGGVRRWNRCLSKRRK